MLLITGFSMRYINKKEKQKQKNIIKGRSMGAMYMHTYIRIDTNFTEKQKCVFTLIFFSNFFIIEKWQDFVGTVGRPLRKSLNPATCDIEVHSNGLITTRNGLFVFYALHIYACNRCT